MKKLILFTLFLSLNSYSSMEEINKNWIYSKLYTKKENGVTRGNKVFKRMVIVKNYAWPVASMTFTRHLGLKEKVNLKRVKNDLINTFDTTKFKVKKSRNTYNLEGFWKEGNRFLSVQIQKLNKYGFAMTVTTARPAYLDSTYPEIKELEKKLKKEIIKMVKRPIKKTSYFPFISAAHAQPTFPGLGGLLPTPNPPNTGGGGGGGGTIPGIGDIIDGGGTIDIGGDINLNIGLDDESLTAIDGWFNSANGIIDRIQPSLDRGLDIADRAVGVAEKLVDPKHMALLGFATAAAGAAGAAIGGLAVNMVIDGLAGAAKAFWKWITDEEGKRIRWDKFKEAKKGWEKQTKVGLELEKKLDNFLLSHKKFKKSKDDLVKYKESGEITTEEFIKGTNLIGNLKHYSDYLEFHKTRLEIKVKNPDVSDTCAQVYFRKFKKFEGDYKDIKAVLDYAKKSHVDQMGSDQSAFCENLEKIRNKIVEAELVINESRIALVNGSEEWKRRELERIDTLKDDIKRINKRWVAWKDKRWDRKIVRKLKKVAKKNKKIDKWQWIKNCRKGLGLFGEDIKKEFKDSNRVSKYFKVKKKCKEKWDLVQMWMYKTELEEREKLLSEVKEDSIKFYDERKKREVLLNPRKYLSNLSNMNRWFRRLEMEMICFEKMDNPAYTKSCKKLSPQMAALYNAGKKANDVWEKECKETFEGMANNITHGTGAMDDFNAWLEENS